MDKTDYEIANPPDRSRKAAAACAPGAIRKELNIKTNFDEDEAPPTYRHDDEVLTPIERESPLTPVYITNPTLFRNSPFK